MNMIDWKKEIRQRLAGLKLKPTREAEIVEELAQHLEDPGRGRVVVSNLQHNGCGVAPQL